MAGFLLNLIIAYAVWWGISRISLLAAWMYNKPGTFTTKHWVFVGLSVVPGIMECISTLLVIFSVAFGLDPRQERK